MEEPTFDLDIKIGANWSYSAGKYWLTLGHYQAKVNQIGKRWEWYASYAQGFVTLAQQPFDHGTADLADQAKRAAEQAIIDHNQALRRR